METTLFSHSHTAVSTDVPHSRPTIAEADRRAVDQVLQSGMLARGAKVRAFEIAMSGYLNAAGSVAAASGTDALTLGLLAMGVGEGDEVIVPTYVCASVRDAVTAVGASPVLCDVGRDWCLTTETVRPLVTSRTRAIVAVHVFGRLADVVDIQTLGVPVIEDFCQALGARPDGLRGLFGFYSFHPIKLLTTGEGGLVATNDAALLKTLRDLVRGTRRPRFHAPMSDLQAALGLSQLERFDAFLDRRAELAAFYLDALQGIRAELPTDLLDNGIAFRFPLRISGDVDAAIAAFAEHGIHVRRGVDALIHREIGQSGFPGAEARFAETLSIPLYPSLAWADAERVVSACRAVLA